MLKILKGAAVAAAMVAALAVVWGAAAHSDFESSVPASGSTVASSPATVTVTFTEEIQKTAASFGLDVTNAAGTSVTSGTASVGSDDRSISVALQPALPGGTYTVSWSNTSADDGDPLDGSFTFAVGSAPVSQPTAMPEAGHTHDETADDADHAGAAVEEPSTGLIVVHLAEHGGSGVDGRAEIVPVDGGMQTQIGVYVNGIEAGSAHANHVHVEASCAVTPPGPHAAELTDIASDGVPFGSSLTVIDVPFATIADGAHTIRVHAGPTGGDKAVLACGEIPAQPEHGSPVALPDTGSRSAHAASGLAFNWLAVALVGLGVAATATGIWKRKDAR